MTYDFDLHLEKNSCPVPTPEQIHYMTGIQIKEIEKKVFSLYQLNITPRYKKIIWYQRMVPTDKDLKHYRLLCTDVDYALLTITECIRGNPIKGVGTDYIGSLICKSTLRLPVKTDFVDIFWLQHINYYDKIKFILQDHI